MSIPDCNFSILVLETDILSVESIDTHRIKICTDRKRSPGADLRLREIMGIHHWKVSLCGNGSFGPTVEHAFTEPTPTKDPEIEDEADEIPLQRDQHLPGKKMYIADALLRLQPQHADPQPTIPDDQMTAHVASVITGLPASDMRLQQIIEAQEEYPVGRQIKTYCSEGWPDKHSVNDAMKPYWSTRGELTVVQNILLKGTRIVIPSSMRLEIVDKIHEGHQGIAKC